MRLRVVDASRYSCGAAEPQETDEQHALAAEAIAQRADRQQQAGEHDRVGIDDPGDLGLRGASVASQRHRDLRKSAAGEIAS
jgi:hypothetical protein